MRWLLKRERERECLVHYGSKFESDTFFNGLPIQFNEQTAGGWHGWCVRIMRAKDIWTC
jgi:hypothetical protein